MFKPRELEFPTMIEIRKLFPSLGKSWMTGHSGEAYTEESAPGGTKSRPATHSIGGFCSAAFSRNSISQDGGAGASRLDEASAVESPPLFPPLGRILDFSVFSRLLPVT
ncbi:unnamed protein product [Caenorhabditis auriculariae]|uniref:Uncharacterized protein n=1 Tax=Caenorhabditis auriculariae TaxID=2777116 RepID=A0A8S1H8X9_9PELO|nr:unnamed protein product [Caenorhabditis auriculariae]